MVGNSTVSLHTTLDPLPPVLRHGLVAVAFCGLLSLVSSVALFTWLTYRLCVFYQKGQLRDGLNQFLLLIYNLVLADIQQAMAFALTSVYLSQDKIDVDSSTCWANGWFVSTGDLASGVFILSIALHTYYAVVLGRQLSNKLFYGGIAGAWIFIYLMAVIGVGRDPHIYKRAGAWVSTRRSIDLSSANTLAVLDRQAIRSGTSLASLFLDLCVHVRHGGDLHIDFPLYHGKVPQAHRHGIFQQPQPRYSVPKASCEIHDHLSGRVRGLHATAGGRKNGVHDRCCCALL
jgi:hypothetical protein